MILKKLGEAQIGSVVSTLWGERHRQSGNKALFPHVESKSLMETVVVQLGNYESDPMKAAIMLETPAGEPVTAVSVNTHHPLPVGEFVVATHNVPEQTLNALLTGTPFFEDTGRKVDFGYVTGAPVWKLKRDEDVAELKKQAIGESESPTPYAVDCPEHKTVYLTEAEYSRQMRAPDSKWACPRCGTTAWFNDDIYEKALDAMGPQEP